MKRRLTLLSTGVAIMIAAVGPTLVSAQSTPLRSSYQLTYADNFDNSFSPDAKKYVFVRTIGGRHQLFIAHADGTNEKQITHGDADSIDPAWSPDGRKIAFVLIHDGNKMVHIMNPDGSGIQPVTPPAQSAIHPSWSPDSKKILYCTDDDLRPPAKNESEIYAIDIATKRMQTLVSGGVNTFPVLSPDGTQLAYRHMIGEMNSEVFVSDADGKNPRNLTNHPSFEGWPAWSPDGKQIVFAGNRYSNYQIFLMNADGNNVRLLANTEGRATSPKWSPDGKKITFTNCRKVDFGRNCHLMAVDVAPSP